MPRLANRLTARKVETTKTPARLADGLGLYLIVEGEFSKNWMFEYQFNGKRRYMGLGSALDVTLGEAREKRNENRRLKASGIDPLENKRAAKSAAKLSAARKLTFAEAAKAYHQAHQASWSLKHARQWLASLNHVRPVIGEMDIAAITTPDVLRAIESLWQTHTITADRIRNRIESVIDWAVVRGHRPAGTNPAAWAGHLDHLLPAPRSVRKPKNYAAMAYSDLPGFMAELRERESVAAAALQFLILCACRTGEALGAKWSEIDFEKSTWVIPRTRMKGGREHRVALNAPAVEVLKGMQKIANGEHIFFGRSGGLSAMALSRVLRRMNRTETVHGFRSCFSDWAHERTGFDNHSIEISLAHSVGNAVEQSYRRGDLLAKRQKLMDAWGTFVTSDPAKTGDNIVELRAAQ